MYMNNSKELNFVDGRFQSPILFVLGTTKGQVQIN